MYIVTSLEFATEEQVSPRDDEVTEAYAKE